MTEPIKNCPQPDPPELVMRADGYHYHLETEMKDLAKAEKVTLWPEPYTEWCAYAARSGLLNDNGIAIDRMKTRTAFYAYSAAWNHLYRILAAQQEEVSRLRKALERTLSWLTSYPGGGTLGPKGPYEQARAALNTQGANSPTGLPIRFALGIGQFENLTPHQIAEAKRWDALKAAEQRGDHKRVIELTRTPPVGAGGSVGAPDDSALIGSFLRHTTVFHQSDSADWLYARDGDGNSASIRSSEIINAIRNIIKNPS